MGDENSEIVAAAAAATVVASEAIRRRSTDPIHCAVYPNVQHAVSNQAIPFQLEEVEAIISKDGKKRSNSSSTDDRHTPGLHVKASRGMLRQLVT